MTGKMPAEGVNQTEFPETAQDVWHWFLTLNAKRQSGMGGQSPIAESEIGWFFRNRHITPQGWEFDALDALDRLAMESTSEAVK